MDDLSDVLGALRYTEANLYGGSYGATAAQYFLAQHPELVRTAILDGGTLLDVPIFELWGETASARCARSSSGVPPRRAAAGPTRGFVARHSR
jgi:pimeloyl-ACP methyl ester carboxylesterase